MLIVRSVRSSANWCSASRNVTWPATYSPATLILMQNQPMVDSLRPQLIVPYEVEARWRTHHHGGIELG
jgi:hypothetical protein